jgi:protein TonB
MSEPEDLDEPGLFRRYRVAIIGVVVVAIGAGAYLAFREPAKPKKKASVSMVNIMPPLPPPPPPPTPPPTPPPQEKEPEPEPEKKEDFVEEKQPDSPPEPETPPEPAPAPMGTDLEGPGGPDFGLAKGGGSGMIGGTGTGNGPGGGGSRFGWYAGQVQSTALRALQAHKHTRSSRLDVKVRIWVDSTGRITRATLSGSSGDPATDRAIEQEIFNGLQLQEPPPQGMPMPIVMGIKARRPN